MCSYYVTHQSTFFSFHICFVFRPLSLQWRHVLSTWEAPILIMPITTKPDSATQSFCKKYNPDSGLASLDH